MTYRGVLLVWGFRQMLMPLVLMAAWTSVERQDTNLFSNSDYLLYYLLMPLIMNLVDCRTVYSFPQQIRDGSLSRLLLKPMHPLWVDLFDHLTLKILQTLTLLPVVTASAWFLRDSLPPLTLNATRVLWFFTALLVAMSLRFVMTTFLALTGFWIEHVENLHLVFNGSLFALLGGMIVPLATIPAYLRVFTDYLPYRYALSFPLEVLRGSITQGQFATGIGFGCLWTLVFTFLCWQLWRHGLRVYSAYGG